MVQENSTVKLPPYVTFLGLTGHLAALTRSHLIGDHPWGLTKEQTTETMDPTPKTKGLRLYPRQWNLELAGAARLPGLTPHPSGNVHGKILFQGIQGVFDKSNGKTNSWQIHNDRLDSVSLYLVTVLFLNPKVFRLHEVQQYTDVLV